MRRLTGRRFLVERSWFQCIFSLFRQWSRHVEMCFSLKGGTVFVYDVLRPTRSCFRLVKGNWNVGRTLTGFYWGTNIHDHCEKTQCLRELVCAILFLNCTKRAQTGNWVSPLIQMSLPYYVISTTEEEQYDFYHLYIKKKSIFPLIFLIADFAEKEGLLVVYDINSAKIYNNKQ